MPGSLRAMEKEEDERLRVNAPILQPEHIKLWLPSDLPAADRPSGCMPKLPKMEAALRVGQCHETLDSIRDRLHAKKHLINRRNKNTTGQYESTRSRTVIGEMGDRISLLALKYNKARDALWALGNGEEHKDVLKELKREHLSMDGEEEQPDAESTRQMLRAGGEGGPRAPKKKKKDDRPHESSRAVLSWIWVAGDVAEESGVLHGCE